MAHASPPTAAASPQHVPGLPVVNGSGDTQARRPDTSRMRSQIACARCRRSKTKCENNGINSICKSCANSGRDCSYEPPTAPTNSGSVQRRDSSAAGLNGPTEVDTLPKRRKKNIAPSSIPPSLKFNPGTNDDPLNSQLLTIDVWKDLFKIYERHFATDFPFLHKRRFLRPLETVPTTTSPSLPRPPHGAPLLLSFLTQTTRFHPAFVAHHGSPVATTGYYAEATRKALAEDDEMSLETTQALLMLGFHEWTDVQGPKGWAKIRNAISYAQALGYQYDETMHRDKQKSIKEEEDKDSQESEPFLDREIQRRTFWSCFIMDRYLSCGFSRPQMLAVSKLRDIQLPCSNSAFSHGRAVRTRLLGENDEVYEQRRTAVRKAATPRLNDEDSSRLDRHSADVEDDIEWEFGKHEGELSLYIQAVELFGEINEWSCDGGRRSETLPPWDEASKFRRLEKELDRLKAALPRHFQMTPTNTDNHIYYETSNQYVLIHALYTHCTLSLFREYMAFCPFAVQKPQGPLDKPLLPLPENDDYWPSQARACFGAARDFANVLKSCQSKGSSGIVLETPIAGFAAYGVSWCALYCYYFPRMDPTHALNHRLKPNAWDVATQSLKAMCTRWRMAGVWTDALQHVHSYFHSKREEWVQNGGSPTGHSPNSNSSESGGGLKDYSADFEKAQKEFGSLESTRPTNNTVDRIQIKSLCDRDSEDRAEAPSPAMTFKSEKEEVPEDRSTATPARSTSFTPVNGNIKAAITTPITETPSASDFPSQTNGSYGYSPSISSNQPYSSSYSPTIRTGNPQGLVRLNDPGQYQGHDLQNRNENSLIPGVDQPQYRGLTTKSEQLHNLIEQGAETVRGYDFQTFQSSSDFSGQTPFFQDAMMYNMGPPWFPNIFNYPTDGNQNQTQDHLSQGQYSSGQASQGQQHPQY